MATTSGKKKTSTTRKKHTRKSGVSSTGQVAIPVAEEHEVELKIEKVETGSGGIKIEPFEKIESQLMPADEEYIDEEQLRKLEKKTINEEKNHIEMKSGRAASGDMEQLLKKIDALESQNKRLSAQLNEMKNTNKKLEKQLSSQKAALDKQITELLAANEKLQQELSEAQAKIDKQDQLASDSKRVTTPTAPLKGEKMADSLVSSEEEKKSKQQQSEQPVRQRSIIHELLITQDNCIIEKSGVVKSEKTAQIQTAIKLPPQARFNVESFPYYELQLLLHKSGVNHPIFIRNLYGDIEPETSEYTHQIELPELEPGHYEMGLITIVPAARISEKVVRVFDVAN